jgi:methionyl aminopeptidase
MNTVLNDAIKGASVHKKVSKKVFEYVIPNMTLKEIVRFIEKSIREETSFDPLAPLNAGIGFPVGVGVNNCVAHYTPNYEDEDYMISNNDIIKIDYGVHYNGMIIDSAFTLHFDPKYDEFINISKEATQTAIKHSGPDAVLGEIGGEVEEFIKSKEITIDGKVYPLTVMKDLSGHLIKPFEIHAGKAVPNIAIRYPLRMMEGEFYAIEPFITTGNGKSILGGPNSHFMIDKNEIDGINRINISSEKDFYNLIYQNYKTLPFCQKWLYDLGKEDYNLLLKNLENKRIIKSYPPIYDIEKSIVSQFEHTIYIRDKGIINLTKNSNY